MIYFLEITLKKYMSSIITNKNGIDLRPKTHNIIFYTQKSFSYIKQSFVQIYIYAYCTDKKI